MLSTHWPELIMTLLNHETTSKYHFTTCPEGKIKGIVGQKKKKKALVITIIYFKMFLNFSMLKIFPNTFYLNKGPSSQGYGFSSGHVWMRELDCEES